MQNRGAQSLRRRHTAAGAAVLGCALLSGCLGEWMGHPGERAPEASDLLLGESASTLSESAQASLPSVVVDHSPLATGRGAQRANEQRRGLAGVVQRWARDSASGGQTAAAKAHRLQRLRRASLIEIRAASDLPPDATPPVLLRHCHRSRQHMIGCLATLDTAPEEQRVFLLLDGAGERRSVPGALEALLQRPDVFDRVRYASAWPRPAVNWRVSLGKLARYGFIAPEQIPALRELYAVNPLLFDIVLKQQLRLPGTELGFPPSVFGPISDDTPAAETT